MPRYARREDAMVKKPKLELTWIGKENRPKLEPRILLEDPEKSYHAKFRVRTGSRGGAGNAEKALSETSSTISAPPRETSVGDFFDNRLIFGDNLLALKALEQEFTGTINGVLFDRQRERLVTEIESKLKQRISPNEIFSTRWALA